MLFAFQKPTRFWVSLQGMSVRRSYLSLLDGHKAIHGLNGINCNDYFEFNSYSKTRSNYSFKLRKLLARINCVLYSLFAGVIKQGNALPRDQHFSK